MFMTSPHYLFNGITEKILTNIYAIMHLLPLFLGLRSTQSPIKAPSKSTDPATTSPKMPVNSRL